MEVALNNQSKADNYTVVGSNALNNVITGITLVSGTLSLIGNSLVMIIMMRKQKKGPTFRVLLAHLALCDLLFALFQLIDIPTYINLQWIYNRPFCKVLPSFQLMSSLAAEGTIVVIAIERYNGISKPLKSRWQKRHVIIALMISWVFAFVSVFPYMIVLDVYTIEGKGQCMEKWPNKELSFIYSMYLFIGSFIIPMFIIAILYARIICIIRKPVHYRSGFSRSIKKRHAADVRVTKLLSIVVLAFLVCVLPNHVGHIISITTSNLSDLEQTILHYVTLIPYPFQCMINPIIYSIVDAKFRADLKMFCLCKEERLLAARRFTLMKLNNNSDERKSSILVSSRWRKKNGQQQI